LDDGALLARDKGTPQGGVVSPLLANLFLHYAFDDWMRRNWPSIRFERYADDIVAHCKSFEEADQLKSALTQRLSDCSLELHPAKTRIVYCKDVNRQGTYPDTKFDFLGYTFRPRLAKNKYGRLFVSFIPALSSTSAKSIRDKTRNWELNRRVGTSLTALAAALNPAIRGWLNYYGRFCRSALNPVCDSINHRLARWALRKYKRLHSVRSARLWLRRISRSEPSLFAHWSLAKP
jgi:group II intron reverse transcriptase/maturase